MPEKASENKDLLQDETLSQKLIKKGFWLYLFSYLIAPGGYLIRLLISNSPEVSVADVGILYSIISLINFLNVYNDLGLTESLQYFLPKFRIKRQYNQIKTTIWLSLGVQFLTAILIALGLWFGAEGLAAEYFQSPIAAKILKYFCFYFLWINLFQTLQSIFIAFQKTFDYQFVEFIKIWAIVWFTFFCFLTDRRSIEWYSLSWMLGLWMGILIAYLLYKKKYHQSLMQGKFEFNKEELKIYTKYAIRSFVGINVGSLFAQIIQQMVVYFLGAEEAGYYANFQSLFEIWWMIIWPIMSLVFPIVTEMIEKQEKKKLNELSWLFYSYFSIFAISLSIFFIILWPEISTILLGEKFHLSWVLLSYGAGFLVFRILASFNFSVLWGMWEIQKRVKLLWICTIWTIIASIIGIQVWKIYGATIAFGIGVFLLWFVSFLSLNQQLYRKINWKFISKNIFILCFLSLLLISLKKQITIDNFWRRSWGLLIVGFWILYYFLLFIFNISTILSIKSKCEGLFQTKK